MSVSAADFQLHPLHAILAGGEFALPEDRPSWRVDGGGLESGLNFVGALEMTLEGRRYLGTGAALSPNWVLTAGHNVDFDDDGVPDAGLALIPEPATVALWLGALALVATGVARRRG